jgi:disulfide bond formation protein DsbB
LGLICLAIALVSAVALGGALAIEHIGGVAPCPLCLDQRIVY